MRSFHLGAALAVVAPLATAQSTTFVETITSTVTLNPFYPSGPQTQAYSLESTLPIECDPGCNYVFSDYYYLFINSTSPSGRAANITAIESYLCTQQNYDLLNACLNCVVANGNERPFGYYTNTSMTAAPTCFPGEKLPCNPNGLLDANQANGWFTNVTNRCSSIGSTVTGPTTVTATPTTTGVYYTTYASGETVSLSVWTGLTSYTSAVNQAFQSVTAVQYLTTTVTEAVSDLTSTSGASSGSSASASSSTAAASSASAKSAAFRRANTPIWARLLAMVL